MRPRILLVDDHEIVREGMRGLIVRSRPQWVIAGEATNGREALEAVHSLKPDVVVIDITMPVMNGLDASVQLAELEDAPRVLIFTMHESKRLPEEVRRARAHGFVLKSQAGRDLIRAIEEVVAGREFFGGVSTT